MTYGPTTKATPSALAYKASANSAGGTPRLFWDCGVPRTRTGTWRVPKILVDLETQEGHTASALFPTGTRRVLVNDPGREIVEEHWGVLEGRRLGPTLGCHLFTEVRGDGLVVVEIVPSNGHCDPRVARSWPGCLRFKKLRVRVVSPGWESTPVDLGPEGDWYFGLGLACSRRFVLYPAGDEAAKAAALRLAAYADLEIPNPFPGLGPGEHVLPKSLDSRWEHLYGNVPQFGPLWPDSANQNGFEAGGARIVPVGGWECSAGAARGYSFEVTRVLSRHGVARMHTETGLPIAPEEWPTQGNYRLYDGRWSVDPWNWPGQAGSVLEMFGWNRGHLSPTFPQAREVNPGLSSTKYSVMAWQPHDCAHLSRVRSIAMPAWYQLRSWAARLALTWSGYDVLTAWSIPNLSSKLAAARAAPGKGGEYLREQAWIAGTMADLLSITPPGPERTMLQTWRDLFLEYVHTITLPNGFARDGRGSTSGGSDNGVPWQEGLPLDCGAAAWFQLGLWASGLFDLWTAGGRDNYGAFDSKTKFARLIAVALLQGLHNPRLPLVNRQPPDYIGTSKFGVPAVPCVDRTVPGSYGGGGSGHAIHDWTHLALWRRVEERDLQRELATTFGPDYGGNLEALRAAWRTAPSPWNVIPATYL